MRRLVPTLLLMLLATRCQSAATREESAPATTTETPVKSVEERLAGAVARGNAQELKRVAKSLTKRKESGSAAALLLVDWIDLRSTVSDEQRHNAIDLYLMLPEAKPPRLFETLIRSRDLSSRRMAWQVATNYPSDQMAGAVSLEMSRRASRGRGQNVGLSPEAATAAKANHLKEAYPLLRTSLMAEGHVAYAKAMIALGADAASDDLLAYLALATPGEILAGELKKVHRTTAELALAQFGTAPPSLHHPNFKHLFYYAVSKDEGLAKQATQLLTGYVSQKEEHFAFLLAQMPPPVQEDFLIKLQRANPSLHKSFVELLKSLSPAAGH